MDILLIIFSNRWMIKYAISNSPYEFSMNESIHADIVIAIEVGSLFLIKANDAFSLIKSISHIIILL